MSITLFIAPLPGTVCPNGVRIVSAETERGSSPRRFTDKVVMRRRVEPFLLTHFQTGKLCRGYGEVTYELELTVRCAYDNGEKTYAFSASCPWIGERRHPHISGTSVCLGDNPPLWRRLLEHGTPCYRLMDFIVEMLSFYNDRSPFFSLSRAQLRSEEDGEEDEDAELLFECPRCGEAVHDGEDYGSIDGESHCQRCCDNANYCEACQESTFADTDPVCVDTVRDSTERWCEHCIDSHAWDITEEGRGSFDYTFVADRIIAEWRTEHPADGEED